MMMIKHFPVFSSVFVLLSLFLSSTIVAAQSPSAAPAASPTVTPQPPAQAPDMTSVPIVPVAPALGPTAADTPTKAPIDIIGILRKAKRFTVLTRLLKTTQLINQLNSQLLTTSAGGITIFAPEDSSFANLKAGFLNSLNDQQKVELVNFHTLSSYVSLSNFDTLTNPVRTQAGENPSRLQLNVTSYGNQINMTTGVVNATVSGVVYSDNKLAIYQVDKVLLPLDFFAPTSLSPAQAPLSAEAEAPGKAEKKKKPSSSDDVGDDDSDTNVVPVDTSGSMISSGMKGIWVSLVFGIALVAFL